MPLVVPNLTADNESSLSVGAMCGNNASEGKIKSTFYEGLASMSLTS